MNTNLGIESPSNVGGKGRSDEKSIDINTTNYLYMFAFQTFEILLGA